MKNLIQTFCVLFLVSTSATAGWKDFLGCNRDHADPCRECSHSEMLEYWPEHRAQLKTSWTSMLDRMTSIEYAFALKQAKLEAAFQYAENRDDLDTMIEITKTMADLGIAEIEEMGRASDQQSKECRAIFSDRY